MKVITPEERLRAIDDWISYKGETAYHLAVHEVTLCSTLRVVSLSRQNTEIVTIERYGTMGRGRAVFYTCGGNERVERTGGLLSVFGREQAIEAIVVANELQRVPMFALACPCVVLVFSIEKLITNVDSGQFISTDSPRQDLSFAYARIEIPEAFFRTRGIGSGQFSAPTNIGGYSSAVRQLPLISAPDHPGIARKLPAFPPPAPASIRRLHFQFPFG